MNNYHISNDFAFLSKLIKTLLSHKKLQDIKWSSDILKLFPSSSIEKTFSKDWKDWAGLMDSQVNFLHECCVGRNLKIILIDLDDDFNCTIIGELEPLSRNLIEDPFNHSPPMILLRRLTKYSAGPGTWLWRIPEYYHLPLYKIIQLKGRRDIQLLYLFNKIQYIRMKTLVSNGMAPISDDGCKIWRFDKNDSQSDKIKESLDLHFTTTTTTPTATTTTASTTTASTTTASTTTASTTPVSTTATSTTTASTTAASTTAASTTTPPTETTQTASTPTISSKTASPSRKAITVNPTATSLVETPSKNDSDKNEDSDDDEVIFRRPGWKRKRPKFELESLSTTKKIKTTEGNYERKRTNFEVKLSQATDKTYKCKVFKCRKIFSSWAQFNQHQDNHSTICKYCYKIFKTIWGCADHSKTCAERHKPKSMSENPKSSPKIATSGINSSAGSSIIESSNSVITIKENISNVVERSSDHDDAGDDDAIIRKTAGKRKQPKFDQEIVLKTKRKNKFDWILSNDETFECEMPQCGKKFTSWTHFEKHQLIYCSERHKQKPRVYECQICYKEFISEIKLKDHVDGEHRKKEFVDLAENLQSKIAECKRRKERKRENKLRRKRRGLALNKSPPKESVAIAKSPEPLAEVIEISDDEDGEVVCKTGCDCVVCKGIGKYLCK